MYLLVFILIVTMSCICYIGFFFLQAVFIACSMAHYALGSQISNAASNRTISWLTLQRFILLLTAIISDKLIPGVPSLLHVDYIKKIPGINI